MTSERKKSLPLLLAAIAPTWLILIDEFLQKQFHYSETSFIGARLLQRVSFYVFFYVLDLACCWAGQDPLEAATGFNMSIIEEARQHIKRKNSKSSSLVQSKASVRSNYKAEFQTRNQQLRQSKNWFDHQPRKPNLFSIQHLPLRYWITLKSFILHLLHQLANKTIKKENIMLWCLWRVLLPFGPPAGSRRKLARSRDRNTSLQFRAAHPLKSALQPPLLLPLTTTASISSTHNSNNTAEMLSNTILTLLLQFAFYSFAFAAPAVEVASHGNSWQYGAGGGVIGFVVLVLDIIVWSMSISFSQSSCLIWETKANYSTVEVLKSNRPPLHKVLWCVVVFLFPIIGLVVYWLFSNRAAHTGGSGYEPIA